MKGLYGHFTSIALNLASPYASVGQAPSGTVWRYLLSHVAPLRRVLGLSLIVTVLAAAIDVWLISYIGRLIDILAASSIDTFWATHGASLAVAAGMLLILKPASQLVRHAVNDIGLQCNAATLVRWRAHDHLSKQSVGWFQEDLTGRTASRLVDIGNYAGDVLYQFTNAMAFALVYAIGIVTLMSDTDPRLALPLLVWFSLYTSVLALFIPRMIRAQQAFQSAKSALTGTVVDGFSNMDTLKLFADREFMVGEHRDKLESTRQALFRTRQIGVALRSILSLLEGIMMVGFVGYGLYLWSNGSTTIGLIGASIALSLRITTMAEWIFDSLWVIFLRVGSLREALKTVAQPLAITHDTSAPELVISDGKIEIDNLSHHYGTRSGGLDQLSLTIEAGEKVGLVGRSGAGKSTLVNLLLRFYEAERGRILIDGQNITDVEQDSLRAAIGMVSQQAALLNRSVRDNIALGREGVSQSDIENAAREARAHEFILDLKDTAGRSGYDAHVGERGIKLSGGQRQRIALSRVVLKGAPLLILDEATSALDSEVEAEIQHALEGVMKNKTVIAIAHRLSTISRMDRIVVMDQGRIVEQGTHVDLLKHEGLYARLWERQSGGFIGGRENPDKPHTTA